MASAVESEAGLLGKWNPGILPAAFIGLAVFLALVGLFAGWFSVDTKVEIWQYDETDAEGKGEKCIQLQSGPLCMVRIDTEMRMTSLGTRITPNDLQDFIEETEGLPSYDAHMGRTGTAMLGVLMLHAIALLGLLGTAGFYLWTRQSATRSFGPSVWRFAGLFGAFALISLLYVAVAVPSAAESDTNDVLTEYSFYLESQGFPPVDPALLAPEVQFWNTWTCCPPNSHFPRGGNEYLVVVTTESRPSAGFWLEALSLVLTTGGLALATNAGHLDDKGPAPPRPSPNNTAARSPPSSPKSN